MSQVHVLGDVWAAIPLYHSPMLGMLWIEDGFDEVKEAWYAAHILGRPTTRAIEEAGVLGFTINVDHGLDSDGVLPVVAEVVGVIEMVDRLRYQGPDLDRFGLQHLALVAPLATGDAISLITDLELKELPVLPAEDGLDHVVQAL